VIVDCGRGSRVLKNARQAGISGGTIVLGRGTRGLRNPDWLEDCDVRKEIVLMISNRDTIRAALDRLRQKMGLERPHHGIAFVLSVRDVLGSAHCRVDRTHLREGSEATMVQAIFVIVDKGLAESAVEAAEAAGARGATILNARGAGVHETSRLFSMEIEPEREIVLVLSDAASCPAIAQAVRDALRMDEPGRGFLFVVDVRETVGLFGPG